MKCLSGLGRGGGGVINDALNIFYLRLYGLDSFDYQQAFFYMHHSIDKNAHITNFVTQVMSWSTGQNDGARCSSVGSVRSWCDGSSDRSFMVDRPLELFLVPANALRLV